MSDDGITRIRSIQAPPVLNFKVAGEDVTSHAAKSFRLEQGVLTGAPDQVSIGVGMIIIESIKDDHCVHQPMTADDLRQFAAEALQLADRLEGVRKLH